MKRLALFMLAIAFTAAAIYAFRMASGSDRIVYVLADVERGDLTTSIRASGSLKALLTVKVGSQLSGQVAELFADFNDEVKMGQPLARLDQRSHAATLEEARAALSMAKSTVSIRQAALAKAKAELVSIAAERAIIEQKVSNAEAILLKHQQDLDRKRQLYERRAIAARALEQTRADRDAAKATLAGNKAEFATLDARIVAARSAIAMAKAELENAEATVEKSRATMELTEIELDRTTIRSPIDGIVIGRNVDRGQTVSTSLEAPTLFEIAQDLRAMEVQAKVDEADIGRVSVGQKVVFTVDSFPGRRFRGEVVQIRKAPQLIQNVVIYSVIISTDNTDLLLLPGMTASVQIIVAQVRNVVKVPNLALRYRPTWRNSEPTTSPRGASRNRGVVWLQPVEGEHPQPVQVTLGKRDRSASEVLSNNLAVGQKVIVGARTVRHDRRFFGLRLGF